MANEQVHAVPETVKAPEIPGELWMLWIQGEPSMPDDGCWVRAIDCNSSAAASDLYLVCFDGESARFAADRQNDLYELNCIPVRVK